MSSRIGASDPHDPDDGVYVISVAAELLGVHPQTLRSYERQGLLRPRRTPGGTRLYSPADMAKARRVLELTGEGLTLTGASRILALEQRIARLTRPSTELVLRRQSPPRSSERSPRPGDRRDRRSRPDTGRPTGRPKE